MDGQYLPSTIGQVFFGSLSIGVSHKTNSGAPFFQSEKNKSSKLTLRMPSLLQSAYRNQHDDDEYDSSEYCTATSEDESEDEVSVRNGIQFVKVLVQNESYSMTHTSCPDSMVLPLIMVNYGFLLT